MKEEEVAGRHEDFNNTRMFVHPATQQLDRNHGDNSRIHRERYMNELGRALDERKDGTVCPIPGCMMNHPRGLKPTHHCHGNGCSSRVHNLCAQRLNLCSRTNELNMYCSAQCKGDD